MQTNNARQRLNQQQLESCLESVKGVVHVGGHFGEEASLYERFDLPVVWIEALPSSHRRLQENLKNHPRQQAIQALCTDKSNQPYQFGVSNNSEGISSSIFEFGQFGCGPDSLWPALDLHHVTYVQLT